LILFPFRSFFFSFFIPLLFKLVSISSSNPLHLTFPFISINFINRISVHRSIYFADSSSLLILLLIEFLIWFHLFLCVV
jgi:hypothetical protein